jgi:mRNA interferase RelE/StbE
MRTIDYSKQAIRTLTELRKSGGKTSEQMRKELIKLEKNPMPSDVKKLKGYELYRVRVGSYRVIYHFDETTIFVTIIDKRDVVYKNL